MSNLDITTLKEKLKNIPTPRPRTIDWCDEYPTSYGDATMRHSAAPAEKQSNQVSDSYHNSYHKQEINVCVKDYTYDEQSFILLDLQAIIKQLFTGVSMVEIPAPGTIFTPVKSCFIIVCSCCSIKDCSSNVQSLSYMFVSCL